MDPSLRDYLSDNATQLMNFIYDGVYVVDLQRNIVFWNRAAERLTGHRADEVSGRCCRDNILNHIDGEGTLLCEGACPLQRALETGVACEAKVWPLHRDGHRFPVEAHIGPITGPDGAIIGSIEVFRDVSADERYRAIEAKFHQVIRRYVSDLTYQSVQADSAEQAPDQSGPGAAHKDMTVVFIDIVGFTPLTERLGPEKTVELLNGFFSSTARGVKVHTGDIDKFIGDCALAVFPDADDAVAAACELLESRLPDLNRDLVAKGLPPVQVRIGINTGTVVQGTIGAADRRDWTVIGDVVNTASRVEGAAPPGGFLITEATLARLADQGRFVLDRQVLLKGKAAPTNLYRLG